jgi:integrase
LAFAGEIERKINERTFDLAEYFPKSKALKHFGLVHVEADIGFDKYALQWLDFKKSVVAYSTYQGYATQVRRMIRIINVNLRDVRPAHIRNLVKTMAEDGLSPKTIINTMFTVNNIFTQAIEEGILKENPCRNVDTPAQIKKLPDPFSYEEMQKILDDMDKHCPHMTAFFAIGFYTGMRTGEILALKWGDIDFIKHNILVHKTFTASRLKLSTKTNKHRYIDVLEQLDSYLQRHKKYTFLSGEWLFINQYGKPIISQYSIVYYWKPCLQRLGIRYRVPYQMRHSFACLMLEIGENPKWISDMLGHADLQMLFKVYGNWYKPNEGQRAGSKLRSFVANQLPNPIQTQANP